MRSGRGKCPQCKEIIVVDLDAPEIRCPLCNALLKKSQKTVEEVRAEEEARVAAALAREKALEEEAAAAETPVTEEPETAVEESPATEVAEEAVEVAPAEEAVEEIAEADVDIDIPEETAEDVRRPRIVLLGVFGERRANGPDGKKGRGQAPIDMLRLFPRNGFPLQDNLHWDAVCRRQNRLDECFRIGSGRDVQKRVVSEGVLSRAFAR